MFKYLIANIIEGQCLHANLPFAFESFLYALPLSLVVAYFQVHDRVLSSSFEGQGDGPGLEASPKVFEIHLALGQSLVQARIIIHYLDPKNPVWLV